MQSTMFVKTRPTRKVPLLRRHLYSLRFKLVLWYLLILAITLCLFSTAIYLLQQNTLYNEADNNLQAAIRVLPDVYDASSEHLVAMNTGIYADMYADNTISVLLNQQGQIVQTVGRPGTPDFYRLPVHFLLSSNAAASQATNGSASGNQNIHFFSTREPVIDQSASPPWNGYAFETVTITNRQGHILNFVLVGLHTFIPDQLSQLLGILVIITPLVLLVSGVGGYWLAFRAIRPVQAITRTAQEIGATDLHRRLNLRRRDELGELAATFDGMLDRLERAFERQRQFTSDASHELRTPLSIVNTELERILQRPHTSEDYIQTMQIIHQENHRMTRLVNSLLTLARADQGYTMLKCEQIDLSEIVIDAVERLAYMIEQSRVEIHLSKLEELLVRGDRLYLTQLCTNLLENAIKYSTAIGKHVTVRLERKQNQACIQIVDVGPGIAAEHLPYIFERFYRIDQSRTHNQLTGNTIGTTGSGLGLPIALWIAQEHGGSIQVQSTFGKGSIFEVCLPIQS